jgi:hypothetical protein
VWGFALSLAAGEAGLAMLAYLIAYELLAAPGGRRDRVRALAPSLAVVVVYLIGFRLGGFGASPGGGYVDPLHAPGTFLRELPERWLVLTGALVAGGNADLWLLRPELRVVLAVSGAVLTAGFVWLVCELSAGAPESDRRAVRWLGAGAIFSALPFAGTPIGSRCLVLPMLGAAAAIGFVLEHAWTAPPRRTALRWACVALAIVHLVVAPIGRLAAPYVFREMLAERVATAMRDAEIDADGLAERDVVVLRAPDFIVGLHGFTYRALYRLPMAHTWRTLSWARAVHRLIRTADDAIEIELVDGELEAPALVAGQVIELDGLRARVVAIGKTGPTRMAFRFDRPLDDPRLVFLAWREGRLRRVVLPAVGQQMVL